MAKSIFPLSALFPVDDPTPIECIGGPWDGEFMAANSRPPRADGYYVPVNVRDGEVWRVVEYRWVQAVLGHTGYEP